MFTVTVNTTVPTLTVVATAHQNTPLKWCLSLRHSQLGSFFPHHPLISYVWKVHPSWLPPSNRSNPKIKIKIKIPSGLHRTRPLQNGSNISVLIHLQLRCISFVGSSAKYVMQHASHKLSALFTKRQCLGK